MPGKNAARVETEGTSAGNGQRALKESAAIKAAGDGWVVRVHGEREKGALIHIHVSIQRQRQHLRKNQYSKLTGQPLLDELGMARPNSPSAAESVRPFTPSAPSSRTGKRAGSR